MTMTRQKDAVIKSIKPIAWAAAVIVAVVLALGAYYLFGNADDKNQAVQWDKVTIAIPTAQYLNGNLVIAEKMGFFKKYGLEVTFQVHPIGAIALAAGLRFLRSVGMEEIR